MGKITLSKTSVADRVKPVPLVLGLYDEMIRDVVESIRTRLSPASKYVIADPDSIFRLEIETKAPATAPRNRGKLLRINLLKYENGVIVGGKSNIDVFSVRYKPGVKATKVSEISSEPAFLFEFAPLNHISFKTGKTPAVYSIMAILVNFVRLFVNIFSLGKTEMVCFSQLSTTVTYDPKYPGPLVHYDRSFTALSIPNLLKEDDVNASFYARLLGELKAEKVDLTGDTIIAIAVDWYSCTAKTYATKNGNEYPFIVGFCKDPSTTTVSEPLLTTDGFVPIGDMRLLKEGQVEQRIKQAEIDLGNRLVKSNANAYYDPIFERITGIHAAEIQEQKAKEAERLSKLAEIEEDPNEPLKPKKELLDGGLGVGDEGENETQEFPDDAETDINFENIPHSISELVLEKQYLFEPVKLGESRLIYTEVPLEPESVLDEKKRIANEKLEEKVRKKRQKEEMVKLAKLQKQSISKKKPQETANVKMEDVKPPQESVNTLSSTQTVKKEPGTTGGTTGTIVPAENTKDEISPYVEGISKKAISSVVITKEHFQNEQKQCYTIFSGDMRKFFDPSREDYEDADTREWKTQYDENTAAEIFDLPVEKLERSIFYLSTKRYQEYNNDPENSGGGGGVMLPVSGDTTLGPFIFWERNVRQLGDAVDFDWAINTYVGYVKPVNRGSNLVDVGDDYGDGDNMDIDDGGDGDNDGGSGSSSNSGNRVIYETHAIFISRLAPFQWISVDLPSEVVVSDNAKDVRKAYSQKLASFSDLSRLFYLTQQKYIQTNLIIEIFFSQFIEGFKLNPVYIPFTYTKEEKNKQEKNKKNRTTGRRSMKIETVLPIYRLEYYDGLFVEGKDKSSSTAYRFSFLEDPEKRTPIKEMVVTPELIASIMTELSEEIIKIRVDPITKKQEFGNTSHNDTVFKGNHQDVDQLGYTWKTVKRGSSDNIYYAIDVNFYTCPRGKRLYKDRVKEIPYVRISIILTGGKDGYSLVSVTEDDDYVQDWRNFIESYYIKHEGFAKFITKTPAFEDITMESFLTSRNSFDVVNSLLIYLPPNRSPNVVIDLMRRRKPNIPNKSGKSVATKDMIQSEEEKRDLYEVAITIKYSKFQKMRFLQGKPLTTRESQVQDTKDAIVRQLSTFEVADLRDIFKRYLNKYEDKNSELFYPIPITTDYVEIKRVSTEIEKSLDTVNKIVCKVDQALVFVEASSSNSKLYGLDYSGVHYVVYIIFSSLTDDGNIPGYVMKKDTYRGDIIDGIESVYRRGYRIGEIIDYWFYIDPPQKIFNMDQDDGVYMSNGIDKRLRTRSSSNIKMAEIDEGVIRTFKTPNDVHFPRNVIRMVFEGIFKLNTMVDLRAAQRYSELMDLDLDLRLDAPSTSSKTAISEPLIRPTFVNFSPDVKLEEPRAIAWFNEDIDYAGMFASPIKRQQATGSGNKIWKTNHGVRTVGRSTKAENQRPKDLKDKITRISKHSMIAKNNTIAVITKTKSGGDDAFNSRDVLVRNKDKGNGDKTGYVVFEYTLKPSKQLGPITGAFEQAFNEYFVLQDILSQIREGYSIVVRESVSGNGPGKKSFQLSKQPWVNELENNERKYEDPVALAKLKQKFEGRSAEIYDFMSLKKYLQNETLSLDDEKTLREETVEAVVELLKGIRKYYRLLKPGATDDPSKLPIDLRGVYITESEIEDMAKWETYMPIRATRPNTTGNVFYDRDLLRKMSKKGDELEELETELGKFLSAKDLQNRKYYANIKKPSEVRQVDIETFDEYIISEDENYDFDDDSDDDDDDEIIYFGDNMEIDYDSGDDTTDSKSNKKPNTSGTGTELLSDSVLESAAKLAVVKNEPESPNNLKDVLPPGHTNDKLQLLAKRSLGSTNYPTDNEQPSKKPKPNEKEGAESLIEAFYTLTLTKRPRCGHCLKPAKYYCISCGPIHSRECHHFDSRC